MNRRNFLTLTHPKKVASPTATAKVLSGLTPYTGTWDVAQVRHLLKRTMFGATKSDIDYFKNMTMTQAVDELLAVPATSPAPPVNNYSQTDPDVPFGQAWVNAIFPPTVSTVNTPRLTSMRSWWVGNMINQNRSIIEKLILFWHNHFPVEATVVSVPQAVYHYEDMLRQNALGNFRNFVKAVTLNPAMLKYLNGNSNTKNAPDENYARELQELFTVGKDNGISPFLEDDVKAAAKVLTGYRINPLTTPISYYFDSTKHDTTNKQFSAFYGNTVIQGQTGANGANELDDLIDMLLNTNEVALHICRRLYNFFVYYKIDATVETNVIVPLADIFRNGNYEIAPVLSALFKSEHFYDMMQIGCVIKNPLDYYIGLCREFNLQFPTASNLDYQYKAWNYINGKGRENNLEISEPDNVSGFLAYYQSPQFHELWINSDTLPKRIQTTSDLFNGVATNTYNLKLDPVAYTATIPNANDPYVLTDNVLQYLYSMDVGQNSKDYLIAILLSGQTDPSYWTSAWDDYVNNPGNAGFYNIVYTRLKAYYIALMEQAEYQLS